MVAATGPVGVGFIGTGMIRTTYLENLTRFPDINVVILGDLDQERARSQAEKHGIPQWGSQIDGRSALEAFADLLDPSVLLEVDLYWATAGGADPVRLVQGLGDRVHAVHVKDGPMRPGIGANPLPTDQLPAARGDVPLAAVLSEAHSIAYAAIEFDHYEGDIFEGITESYRFLTSTLSRASG